MKVLIYNAETGDIKASAADQNGKVFQKYLEEGYKPIGFVAGFSTTVFPFTNERNKGVFEEKSFDFSSDFYFSLK
jgi:hypothetical protein